MDEKELLNYHLENIESYIKYIQKQIPYNENQLQFDILCAIEFILLKENNK
jgi:hypothetical protein